MNKTPALWATPDEVDGVDNAGLFSTATGIASSTRIHRNGSYPHPEKTKENLDENHLQ